MRAIADAFPDVEVIVLPEGAFYWLNPEQGTSPGSFEFMDRFLDGMANVNNSDQW